MAYKGSGKKNQSFVKSVQNLGAPKRKNRNNKSTASIAKSAARGKSQANRPQKGMTQKNHGDGRPNQNRGSRRK